MANTVYSYSPTVPRPQWPRSVVSHSSVITVGEGVRGWRLVSATQGDVKQTLYLPERK